MNGEGTHTCAFCEMMSNLHNSLGESMWREFCLSLDFPYMEGIPIVTVTELKESYYIYLEL